VAEWLIKFFIFSITAKKGRFFPSSPETEQESCFDYLLLCFMECIYFPIKCLDFQFPMDFKELAEVMPQESIRHFCAEQLKWSGHSK
jgi:hypothetical protein